MTAHSEEGCLPASLDGQFVLRKRPRALAEMLAQVTPENLHAERDTGPPVGNEEW